jgi:hypothetical protein
VIHVIKYVITVVMGFVLFLSNIAIAPVLLEKGSSVVSSILTHEGELKSDKSAFAVTLFLEQTAFELSSFLVADHEWLTRLNEQGIIRGAYLDVQGKGVKLGEPFVPLRDEDGGYHLNEGALHFVYRSDENGLFLDALVNTKNFPNFVHPNIKKPRFILIYDLLHGEVVFLHGRQWELPDLVFRRLKQPEPGDFFVVTNKIITVKMLSGVGEGIAVVSLYSLLSVRQLMLTLALIVIGVLSIILLALSVWYTLSGQLPFWKGATVMAENSGKKSVVNEIDREISDLFEEESAPEQPVEPVIKKSAVAVTEEQPPELQPSEGEALRKPVGGEETAVDETASEMRDGMEQDLVKDGIIIKKG